MAGPYELDYTHLALLMNKLETDNFTGKVSCESISQKCELYYYKGKLIQALSDGLKGLEALYVPLFWMEGTLKVEERPHSIGPGLDDADVKAFRAKVKDLQKRGLFEKEFSDNEVSQVKEATPIAPLIPAKVTAQTESEAEIANQKEAKNENHTNEAFLNFISKPVEWGNEFSQPVAKPAPKKSEPPPTLAPSSKPADFEEPTDLEAPISFNIIAPTLTPKAKLTVSEEIWTASSKEGKDKVISAVTFTQCLPPGRLAEPILSYKTIKLEELIGRVSLTIPNSYILINSKNNNGSQLGLLLIEQGKLTTARYANNSLNLKAQEAYDELAKLAATTSCEVAIYTSNARFLSCYRTLMGGNNLVKNAQAAGLDLQSLLKEQVYQKATVALRLYTEHELVFFLIHEGEPLGSFKVKGNQLDRDNSLSSLLNEKNLRFDLLSAIPPEVIQVAQPEKALLSTQVSVLTEATRYILQFLNTLAGQPKMQTSVKLVLESANRLFPCFQRLNIGVDGDRIDISWTLDHTQIFVTRSEAQAAFNFLIAALLSQHNDLIGQDTMRELVRRTLLNNGIDLKKEQLVLECLA